LAASFFPSLGFANASLLRELVFERGLITLSFGLLQFSVDAFGVAIRCLHRYWRHHFPSLARFADPFDQKSPRMPNLCDLMFQGRSIALGSGFLRLCGETFDFTIGLLSQIVKTVQFGLVLFYQRANESVIDGRLPRGFGLKRLIDLPVAWPDQWRALGLRAPARS
jgi:hypothetical protein